LSPQANSGKPTDTIRRCNFRKSSFNGIWKQGNTSRKLQMEYKELNKQFRGRHLWARGYFVSSSGNVTDEVIQEYIQNQDLEERVKNDNFDIGQF